MKIISIESFQNLQQFIFRSTGEIQNNENPVYQKLSGTALVPIMKNNFMATDKGQPSGTNKQESSGVPNKIEGADGLDIDRRTESYTDEAGELTENVRVLHPNRNVDKDIDAGPAYS